MPIVSIKCKHMSSNTITKGLVNFNTITPRNTVHPITEDLVIFNIIAPRDIVHPTELRMREIIFNSSGFVL